MEKCLFSYQDQAILYPFPTRLLEEVLSFVNASILPRVDLFLLMGYTQAFKVTVIERSLKKSSRDPAFLTNYRPISNLSFRSEILEIIVVK